MTDTLTAQEAGQPACLPSTLPDNPMVAPKPPAADAPEHERAFWWRTQIVGLSRTRLAALTGFSVSRIADIEAGVTRGSGQPVDPATMTRYRMACAAVAMGAEFDWQSVRLHGAPRK